MYFSNQKNYDLKKPWISWGIWEIIFFLVNMGIVIIAGIFITKANYNLLNTVATDAIEIIMILVSLILNKHYTKEKLVFENWNWFNRSIIISLILIYYLYMSVSSFFAGGHPWHFLILACLVGICEELIFRGILLTSLISNFKGKKAIIYGILCDGLMFGCAHFVNFWNQPIKNTLIQVTYTALLGMIFACVYLRTANLLAPMMLHMMLDLTSMSITKGTTSTVANWSMIIPILAVTLLVLFTQLRPKAIKQIERDFRFKTWY